MLLILIIIVSVSVLFAYFHANGYKNSLFMSFMSVMCFFFSCGVVVSWFTLLVEQWQLTLNTPWAYRETLPVWAHFVQNMLRHLAFGLPVSRLTLGFLYTLPILLTPVFFIFTQQVRRTQLMLYATLINLSFFWIQLSAEYSLRATSLKIPIQSIVVFITYGFVMYALFRFRERSNKQCVTM